MNEHQPRDYRGRFAPSPTGPLHVGSLVAAVASFLDARKNGGAWLARIEDIDGPRVMPGAAGLILRTLAAYGMESDAPVVYQSTRRAAYHSALHALRRTGTVYACGCSRSEIADSGIVGREGYVYPGACRTGLPAGRRARSWRVNTQGAAYSFDDRVQGTVSEDIAAEFGDFVLYRADSVYAYQLAVVVDDAEQGITHVVRGADLLDSTARQMHLQQLLGLRTPRYAHVPVVVDARGEKLSKQTRAAPIDPRHPAPALVCALRFLGLAPPAELARAPLGTVWAWAIESWDIERVPKCRAQPLS